MVALLSVCHFHGTIVPNTWPAQSATGAPSPRFRTSETVELAVHCSQGCPNEVGLEVWMNAAQ
jgi:hypothetical protein